MSFNAGREFGGFASWAIGAGLIAAMFSGIWPLLGAGVALYFLSRFYTGLGQNRITYSRPTRRHHVRRRN